MGGRKEYRLRVRGIPVVVGLEGFPGETLPRLGGLAVELEEEGSGRESSYTVRLRGVVPSRAGPPPRDRALSPFVRHRRDGPADLVILRGGTVRLVPGSRTAEVTLRGPSRAGSAPWQAEAVLAAVQHALALGGWATLHAAAFELHGMGVVAMGPTHSGKTTLCLAVLAAGGRVVSDDWLAVGAPGDGGAGTVVLPLRRDIWLRGGSLEILAGRIGGKPESVGVRGEGRWRLGRGENRELFVERVRPDVVLHVQRDRRLAGFRVRRSTAAEGLAWLVGAASPLFLGPRYGEERERLLPVLAGLVGEAACFEVRLGRALVERPAETVRALLAALG